MSFELIKQVVKLTNNERAKAGLQPLKLNDRLVDAAQDHSDDMAKDDFFSHTGVDGSSVSDRVKASGYQYSTTGENIAAGQTTAAAVVRGWMNSPGHRANILNPNYTEIGVGYEYLQNDTGSVNYNHYWTQVFGTPLNNNRAGSKLESPMKSQPTPVEVEETSDLPGLEMTDNKQSDSMKDLNLKFSDLNNSASPKGNYQGSFTGQSDDSQLTGDDGAVDLVGNSEVMARDKYVAQFKANFMELLDNSFGSSVNIQDSSELDDFVEYISKSDFSQGTKNTIYEMTDSFM